MDKWFIESMKIAKKCLKKNVSFDYSPSIPQICAIDEECKTLFLIYLDWEDEQVKKMFDNAHRILDEM